MGLYDTVNIVKPDGEFFRAQVKCWDRRMVEYKIGDAAPQVHEKSTYIIVLREGGYLYVVDGILMGWASELVNVIPVYDKWGDPYEGPEANRGLLSEPYTWPKRDPMG